MPSSAKTTKISSTFDELTNKIKTLNRNINTAEGTARKFDSALKLDTNNIEVAQQKFKSLSSALKSAQERFEASKQQVKELNNVFADNQGNERYKSALEKATINTQRFGAEVERLKVLVNNAGRELDNATPKVKSFSDRLKENVGNANLYNNALKTAKRTLIAMAAATVKLTKEMADLGKTLTANASKYDTTVEKLQEQSYMFYALTGNADAYTSSLQAMNSVMAQILSGRGQSQLQSLAQIGIGKADIEGKSTAEAYEVIFDALKNVGDQAKATAVAVKLFGDAGAYVSELAYSSEEVYNKYIEKFKQIGGVSTESAQALSELSNDLYLLKTQLNVAWAEIIKNLMPTIQEVLKILVSLSQSISKLTDTFGAVGTIIILTSTIITAKLIPSLIKLIAKTIVDTGLTWKQVAAKIALAGAITMGIGAIIGVTTAISAGASVSKLATNDMNKYADSIENATKVAKEYEKISSKLSNDLSISTENIKKSESTYSADVKFTVEAKGDTQVSRETAKEIATLTTDQINKALGGIIG